MSRLGGGSSDATAPPCRGRSDSLGLVCVTLSSLVCMSFGVQSVGWLLFLLFVIGERFILHCRLWDGGGWSFVIG